MIDGECRIIKLLCKMEKTMNNSFGDNFRRDFSRLFSNNENKLVEKLIPLVGESAAIALVGNEKTSKSEIEVVAKFISNFSPLNIYSYKTTPRKAVLSGRSYQGNLVHIHPQFRIVKPPRVTENKRQDYWYVDFAVQIFSKRIPSVCIGLWGAEYDGHTAHFVESGVLKSHFRDVVMENEIGMRPIHITKDHWKKYPNEYINNLLLYIDRRNAETESLSDSDLNMCYFNLFESPELEVVGNGPVKQGLSWELIETSE